MIWYSSFSSSNNVLCCTGIVIMVKFKLSFHVWLLVTVAGCMVIMTKSITWCDSNINDRTL